jgi:hypothetical protein
MLKSNNKWWLAAALMFLAPAAMMASPHDRGCDPRHGSKCQQVPEGGSTAIYLLGAGMTCLGAIFLRTRFSKR